MSRTFKDVPARVRIEREEKRHGEKKIPQEVRVELMPFTNVHNARVAADDAEKILPNTGVFFRAGLLDFVHKKGTLIASETLREYDFESKEEKRAFFSRIASIVNTASASVEVDGVPIYVEGVDLPLVEVSDVMDVNFGTMRRSTYSWDTLVSTGVFVPDSLITTAFITREGLVVSIRTMWEHPGILVEVFFVPEWLNAGDKCADKDKRFVFSARTHTRGARTLAEEKEFRRMLRWDWERFEQSPVPRSRENDSAREVIKTFNAGGLRAVEEETGAFVAENAPDDETKDTSSPEDTEFFGNQIFTKIPL